MGEVLLLLVVALTVAAVVFGVTVLVSGRDPGLVPVEPDGRAVPLPGGRPLHESDVAEVRFDTALRGYRMTQVDQAMRRAAYDIGYKSELIGVLEAEVAALRAGRTEEAEALRRAREEAAATSPSADAPETSPAEPGLTAEPGLAAAPAAAAVEDETPPVTGAGSAVNDPVRPTDETESTVRPAAAEPAVSVRPAVDPTAEALEEPAAAVTGKPADEGTPTLGAVVRSEPA